MTDQNQAPQPPEMQQPGLEQQPSEQEIRDSRDLRTAQNLLLVAGIAGPFSLILGGVLVSTAALVCGIIAFFKLRAVSKRSPHFAEEIVKRLRIGTIVALIICSVVFVLNAYWFVQVFQMTLEAVRTGDFSHLFTNTGGGESASTDNSGSSTWG